MWNYDLLGLSVCSEIRLAAEPSPTPRFPERCEVRFSTDGDTRELLSPSRELVARFGEASEGYEVGRAGSLLVATFGKLVSLTIDVGEGSLRASGDPEAVAYVVPNAGLALYLLAKAQPVLHASAVEWQGRTHGILGGTGTGKTTLAALLCGAGARLVTDDTLRLRVDATCIACWGGTRNLRLRPSSGDVARFLTDASPASVSGDGRTILGLPAPHGSSHALASMVFPRPDPHATRAELRRQSRSEALQRLTEATRVRGLRDRALLTQQLQTLGALARAIPSFEARLPWGPPFQRAWGEELLELLETSVPRQ